MLPDNSAKSGAFARFAAATGCRRALTVVRVNRENFPYFLSSVLPGFLWRVRATKRTWNSTGGRGWWDLRTKIKDDKPKNIFFYNIDNSAKKNIFVCVIIWVKGIFFSPWVTYIRWEENPRPPNSAWVTRAWPAGVYWPIYMLNMLPA